MRVYHFLPAKWVLGDIERRRLKIAKYDDLNDPFELDVFDLSDPDIKRAWTETKKNFMRTQGLGCFSRNWKNPLLWSHYADKHRGICLGFDVNADVKEVNYTKNRLDLTANNFEGLPEEKQQKLMEEAIRTKYIDWSYEQEMRVIATLEERDACTGFYFHEFDEELKLKEVIAGPLCTEENWKKIEEAVRSNHAATVKPIKARLSDNSFEVVEDEHGFGEAR